jgi:rhodanese-related sulfurtransferase
MKPCITCDGKPTKNGHYKAHIEPFAKKGLPKDNKHYHDKTGSKFMLDNVLPNRCIFYFGTMKHNFTLPVQMREKAYSNLKNSGVTRSDSNGNATVYLHCPQVYLNDNGKAYHRHFHFMYYDEKNNEWEQNLFTQPILCEIKKAEIAKYPKAILIDARPTEYYEKKHLPHAVSLPVDSNITTSSVFKAIHSNKPECNDKLVPMLLYCAKNCTASDTLAEKLNKLGFHNIMKVKM